MRIVIVGLPQAGQQELFSLLTNIPLESFQQKAMEIHRGVCQVKDPRIAKLIEMYHPKKTTYATIEYFLLPDFNLQGPSKATIFKELKNADELCFVCRSNDDVESFLSELVIADLMFVEKRLENLAKNRKKKFEAESEKEQALIERCKKQLEQEKPLHQLEFNSADKKTIASYQFLTMKPVILVLNVAEDQLKEKESAEELEQKHGYPVIQVSAGLEQEISQLEPADKAAFMDEMGITESALDKMSRQAFKSLGLISFFTVGEDEVRAWPVKAGSTAPEAGSVIHTDIAKGFVRAEQFTYDDLISFGSEAKVKEAGKFSLKGRDYVVQDADVLSFRFNV